MIHSAFNPFDWYWAIEDQPHKLWSSSLSTLVDSDDPRYKAWINKGNVPSIVPSLSYIRDNLIDAYPRGAPPA